MRKKASKLNEVLSSFSHQEKIKFKEFLNSPFFNKNPKMLILYKGILNGDAPEKIWRKIDPAGFFQVSKFHSYNGRLLKLANHFLVHNTWDINTFEGNIRLIQEIKDRNTPLNIRAQINAVESHLQSGYSKIPDHHWFRYKFEFIKLSFLVRAKPRKKESFDLSKANKYLDISYLIHKLRLACTALSNGQIFGGEIQPPLLPPAILDLAKEYQSDSRGLHVYLQLYLLFQQRSEGNLESLLTTFEKFQIEFEQEERFDILILIHNWIAPRANRDVFYAAKLLSLLEIGFSTKIIQSTGKQVTSNLIKNYIQLGIRLGRQDKSFEIIRVAASSLPDKLAKTMNHFLDAQLTFRNGEYGVCKKHLMKVEHGDQFIAISSRILLAKAYYKLGEYEVLRSSLQSLVMYINRQKAISSYHKKLYKGFISMLRKILTNPSTDRLQEFLSKVKKGEYTEKQWLLDELDALLAERRSS